MRRRHEALRCLALRLSWAAPVLIAAVAGVSPAAEAGPADGILISSPHLRGPEGSERTLGLDAFFVETREGRFDLPVSRGPYPMKMEAGGRTVEIDLHATSDQATTLRLTAEPAEGVVRWGLSVSATPDERFTGLMERVVDGPQQASWAPAIQAALDLRGQRVEMIVKPTTSVYAPFYVSSRNYALAVRGTWPGVYDFCRADPERVRIAFEGPRLEIQITTAAQPMELVRAHALENGPPFLPPRWAYRPWRWRDEHSQLPTYYDGTPARGPFNSQLMEDVLMMRAFGIPCGVYWIDRPWAPGRIGYDDFEIDAKRLPRFPQTIAWLDSQQIETLLWIAPFFQGRMERAALARGYNLTGQRPQPSNYPTVDFTNTEARAFWQDGVARLLKLGVAGFKLDRGEEGMPEEGPFQTFDGRSIRENRNAYPVQYIEAVHEVARKHRGDDFVLLARGAYAGSTRFGTFWGGDIGGTQEGLRASIIAIQRAAVMGYPNWGADTCGYGDDVALEQEVCGRWLGFAAVNPIMEVGPTRNVAFWSLPRTPSYDPTLIAIWRLYARLHERLADYSHAQAQRAHLDGTPIVRPLFLVEPDAPEAWTHWWTFLYGPDILAAPIWEKDRRTQQVYLPRGSDWRDAWRPGNVHPGGQTIEVRAELHQLPLFTRVGSTVELGDLNREWAESLAIARQPPDLAALDAEAAAWLAERDRR